MQRDTKKNYQLYGRNDMIMLDEHNKIYGSLGLAEPYIVATKEGETLLLDGAKDNEPFVGLSIYGKSQQKTTTGAQLFDCYTFLSNQITAGVVHIDADGRIILDGEFDWRNRPFSITLLPGTYTLSADPPEIWHILAPADSYFPQTLQVDEITTYECYIASGTYDRIATTPMINQGSKALPWEPYTGGQSSPNPDYPQEIVSVGDDGEIGVNVYGGNLLTDTTEKVVSGNIGTNVNDVSARYRIIVDKNLLDKELIFSFDSDSNIGKNFVCQTNATTVDKSNWSAETVKQIVKGRNYFPLAKTFDEIPENNIINFYVQLRVYEGLDEVIQFTISNPMLNVGSTSLPFEPYKQPQSLIVSTPNGLPGIPVYSGGNYTDENGQQWISDEIDFKRGKYVQRVTKYKLVSSDISKVEGTGLYYGILRSKFVKKRNYPIYCTHLSQIFYQDGDKGSVGICSVTDNDPIRLYLGTGSSADDYDDFANNNDVWIYYISTENPTETDLTPEQITAYQSLHTNYPTTTVMNDSDAGMKAIYKQIENGG